MKLVKTALFAASLFVLAGGFAAAQDPSTTNNNNTNNNNNNTNGNTYTNSTNGTSNTMSDTSSSLTANGTVVSSGTTSVVVRLDDGTERTFAVDNRSSVPSNLTAGARVNVRYASESGGYRAITVTNSSSTMPNTSSNTTSSGSMTSDNNAGNTAAGNGTTDNNTLPSTASAMPLIALAGLIALTAALLMGSALRRA